MENAKKFVVVTVEFPAPNGTNFYLIPDNYITDDVAKKFHRHSRGEFTEDEENSFEDRLSEPEFNERVWLRKDGVVKIPQNINEYTLPPNSIVAKSFVFKGY